MNIYILDKDPKKSASYYCDAHIKVYCLRMCQSLSTAHWYSIIDNEKPEEGFRRLQDARLHFYEKYYEGHPKRPPYKIDSVSLHHTSTIWLTKQKKNYLWGVNLLEGFCDEYFLLRNKEHKARTFIDWFRNNIPESCKNDEDYNLEFEHVVPEDVHGSCSIESYRNFYKEYKSDIAKWERSKKPEWF